MPTLKPEQEQAQSVCSGDRRSGWPTGATAISLTGTGAGTQRRRASTSSRPSASRRVVLMNFAACLLFHPGVCPDRHLEKSTWR